MFDDEAGPGLAAEIAAADVSALDDAGALALAAAAQRLAGWAASLRLAAAARFAALRPATDHPMDHPDIGGCSTWAVDELAATLTCSRAQARTEIDRGQLLGRLLATAALLAAGQITEYKATLVIEQAQWLAEDDQPRLDERMATRLAGKTTEQIRRAAARAVQAIDPAAAVRRRARAHRERGVWFTPDHETGMTRMTADLDPVDGNRLEHRLRQLAEQARTPGDSRTLAQRMLQALVDLALLNPHTRQPNRHDTANDGTIGRTDTDRRRTTGHAPTTDGRPTTEVSDETAQHEDERDQSDRDDYGSRDSDLVDIPGSGCGHTVDTPVVVQVTVSADTLLGRGHEPGHLAGYGPIDAALARRLAHDPHATWRRILTDPATGAVLDVGHTRYTPPAALARHIRARDQTCRFPGCVRTAARCHQDHTIAYSQGGSTAEHNLGELCTHHHRLKHHAGWQLTQPEPGTFIWTSPTKAIFTVTSEAA